MDDPFRHRIAVNRATARPFLASWDLSLKTCWAKGTGHPAESTMPNANLVAYLVFYLWPVVTWVLFSRLDASRALLWTILGGYMLLPPVIAIDLPMVPDFDKYSIPSLSAAAAVLFLLRQRFGLWPQNRLGQGLIVLYILSPFATVLTNTDPIHFQQASLPAMRIYDSLAVVAGQFIALLPFFLARKYLSTPEALHKMALVLVSAGLIYSVPMLFEVRMSPQLNLWIYGYFQHDFSQAMRFGGFRPFVFMPHGLWVAFFALMCLLAAVALFREGPSDRRMKSLVIVLYLAAVLVLCRSAGPLIYALALTPLLIFTSRRTQLSVAMIMASIVITYPLLRGLHLVPIDDLVNVALGLNAERGQSLAFRVTNEELLLARAAERPLFGWGGYGRNLLHDPVLGTISIIADGGWIITLGTFGWLGYVAEFGLLALPLFLIARESWHLKPDRLSPFVGLVALILAANLFDMLPNDTLIPFTWLMAGALFGYAEDLARQRKRARQIVFEQEFRPGRTIL
jgi:hypothetical protein